MKKNILYVLLFLGLFHTHLPGQNRLNQADSTKQMYYEFGMNMTGLINQFIPLKQVNNKTGPYSATFKRVNGRNGFRMGIGMIVLTDDNFSGGNNDVTNLNLRIGFERQHFVNSRFTFYQTFDFMIVVGDFNSPINDFSDSENAGVGMGLGLGVEYYIFDNFTISTEGIGFVGVAGGTSSIFTATVIPPISIFLNYKF